MSQYEDRSFVAKDIWDKREFNRKDGSVGTVQKIINKDDKSLVIWDNQKDMKGLLKKGKRYHATKITIKQNQDGYDEWHTGKYTVITPLITDGNKEFHEEVTKVTGAPAYNAAFSSQEIGTTVKYTPTVAKPESYTKKDLHDLIIHTMNRLDYIADKLDFLAAKIELLEKKI